VLSPARIFVLSVGDRARIKKVVERGRIGTMPRYIIERKYTVDDAEVPTVARRSKQLATEQFPDIIWEHSHVVVDKDGTPKSFCVYDAPDEDTVRRHADLLGNHVIENVYVIGGDVTPDDFPL
jgi:Protein of unknown function (DUF4242)